jgi:hypothetical protein
LVCTDAQQFTVIVPRYKLPEGSVHAVYPPQGHADNVEILPHIVLSDPQLPWATRAVPDTEPKGRNRVPWLAILVFRQEELSYPKLAGKMNNMLAASLPLGELEKLVAGDPSGCTSPVLKDGSLYTDDESETEVDFIFVPKDLFNSLFSREQK